ncbi:MAG TPA: prepilin-type N-terminal cleavage/methylation domain-containing protein [Tepidisphaeraceae bacterium]|jgi:prepilin-type N-terminal cleavage/methylation domain-containing protein
MNQTETHLRRQRGFTLIEMLATLVLLTAFALIGARLFTAAMRLIHSAQAGHTAMMQSESALRRLRADAWAATKIEAGPQSVTITRMDGSVVQWKAQQAALSRAVEGNEERAIHWQDAGAPLQFISDGRSLVVQSRDEHKQLVREKMVSQLALWQAGER